jgi:hypothetical protein
MLCHQLIFTSTFTFIYWISHHFAPCFKICSAQKIIYFFVIKDMHFVSHFLAPYTSRPLTLYTSLKHATEYQSYMAVWISNSAEEEMVQSVGFRRITTYRQSPTHYHLQTESRIHYIICIFSVPTHNFNCFFPDVLVVFCSLCWQEWLALTFCCVLNKSISILEPSYDGQP